MKKNNKKFSLHTLDEYAKTISYALAQRLYEAKTTKKFNKALFEAVGDRNIIPYEFWIDNFVIDEYGLPDADVIRRQLIDYGVTEAEMVVTEDGLAIRTTDDAEYSLMLDGVEELFPELPSDIINNNIDSNYLANN